MQPPELTFVELAALVLRSILDILGEPLVELIMRVKKAGHDEMEQCPELCVKVNDCWRCWHILLTLHGVLNRCTSQKQTIATLESKQCLPPYARGILDVLSLIEDHILPFHTLEILLVLSNLIQISVQLARLFDCN